MKLIVGLGNPGIVYARSRHNVGFAVVKSFAKKHRVSFRRDGRTSSLCGRGIFGSQEVILAMPLTYMNLSGRAVLGLVEKHGVSRDELLVVCDDLDLDVGRLRIRKSGSSGGHKGLASILEALGTKDFARLRIGIGKPDPAARMDISDYVLSGVRRQEKEILQASIDDAAECCSTWVADGIDKSMNMFNKKTPHLI